MNAQNQLRLKIKTEGKEFRLDINSGQKLTLGRSPEANIAVTDSSVSLLHLEILWTGFEVIVKDLSSSNGTVRLPQESPFVEGRFAPRLDDLKLKLAQSKVTISWQPIIRQGDSTQHTEVLVNSEPVVEATEVLEKTKISKKVEEIPRAPKRVQEKPLQVVDQPKEVISDDLGLWTFSVLISILFIFGQWLYLGSLWRGVWTAAPYLLHHGAAIDAMLIWLRQFHGPKSYFYFLLFFIGLWIVAIKFFKTFEEACAKASAIAFKYGIKLNVLKATSISLFCIGLLLPILWGFAYGVGPKKLLVAERFIRVQARDDAELATKVHDLKAFVEDLKGSSFLYKELVETQHRRVFKECGGVGDKPWEPKRICLVLLLAVGIESYQQIQPALLFEIASRLTLLMSLDGITRTLPVEGIESNTLPYFLNSLDSVGLQNEHQDLEKILASKSPPGDILQALRNLRRSIELKINLRQAELKIPLELKMMVPGPLESGL